jgi:hypothetical protein
MAGGSLGDDGRTQGSCSERALEGSTGGTGGTQRAGLALWRTEAVLQVDGLAGGVVD